MRILIICLKSPYPKRDGGCVAMANQIEALVQMGKEVTVFVFETHKHPFNLKAVPLELRQKTQWHSNYVDTKLNAVDAFTAFVNRESYNLNRFYSADIDKKLIEILDQRSYDIVQLESLFTTPYISTIHRCSGAKIVLRSHNLEFQIWERQVLETPNILKRAYLGYLAKGLKKAELEVAHRLDGIACISETDQAFFQENARTPNILIPFGLFTEHLPQPQKRERAFFHLGAMDWTPNITAMNAFIRNAWIPFVERHPEARLHLAGRKCDQYTPETPHPSILNHGEVENSLDFMSRYETMIVPLFAGSGIRIKIIEGSAMGIPVITTPIGIQNIEHQPNESVLIAEEWDCWQKHLEFAWENPSKMEEIGLKGQAIILKNHDIVRSTEKIVKFYEKILGKEN